MRSNNRGQGKLMKPRPDFKSEIDTPALVIDLDVLDANIAKMQSFFDGRTANLRPHFKTHKCPPIARRQLRAGAKGVTCAKVGEAEVLVEAGVKDILIANQVVGCLKIRRLARLLRRARVTVAVDEARNVKDLSAAAAAAGAPLGVLVEVDIGMGRCGVKPGKEAVELARCVARCPGLEFRGLQGYEGHLVLQAPGGDKDRLTLEALSLLVKTVGALCRAGIECKEVSGGGTGTYRTSGAHPVMSEIQAGSYATMDARYAKVTPEFGNALFCVVTIVNRPKKNVAIGDAGMKSLTTEFGMPQAWGIRGVKVERLAEEHTLMTVRGEGARLVPGDKILLVPSHGCTTFNLHDRVYGVRDGSVECRWRIAARGRAE